LKRGKHVARELSRVVAKEFEKAIEELGHRRGTDRAEAIHETRKCLKKARAVLHLLKHNLGHDYGILDGGLRRIAHQLSTLRDVDASLEVVKALRDHYPGIVTGAIFRAAHRGLLARKRGTLARVFDHGPMKQAADKKVSELTSYFNGRPAEGRDRTTAYHLYNVADVFAVAQYNRHEADYNTVRQWEPREVLALIGRVSDAFESWSIIREEPAAQAYLVSMLPTKERRQTEGPSPGRRPRLTEGPNS
jgi:hypothetical protein